MRQTEGIRKRKIQSLLFVWHKCDRMGSKTHVFQVLHNSFAHNFSFWSFDMIGNRNEINAKKTIKFNCWLDELKTQMLGGFFFGFISFCRLLYSLRLTFDSNHLLLVGFPGTNSTSLKKNPNVICSQSQENKCLGFKK